jgi:hypothetical protein
MASTGGSFSNLHIPVHVRGKALCLAVNTQSCGLNDGHDDWTQERCKYVNSSYECPLYMDVEYNSKMYIDSNSDYIIVQREDMRSTTN